MPVLILSLYDLEVHQNIPVYVQVDNLFVVTACGRQLFPFSPSPPVLLSLVHHLLIA